MEIKRFVLAMIAGCGIAAGTVCAQQFPAIVEVPVTFYDFHSDKSNPEFEQPHFGGVHLGMVDTILDAGRKPVPGSAPYRNYYIKKWFQPWQAGDFTVPSYTVLSGGELNAQIQYNGIITLNYDTAFKNVVIPMTLPFTYIQGSTGMYQYSNQSFFMLDGRGFGGEGQPHNFSFTMELHSEFTYQPGLVLQFEGDDDVWAFINGRLAMDLGGIHMTVAGSINLDTLTGMQIGKKYNFDLFYAERHTTSSDIKITTNLFTPPGYLQLFSKPDAPGPANPRLGLLDTATAGQNYTLYAHVFDSLYNWISDSDSLVTWTIVDTAGKPLLTTMQGLSTGFIPSTAYGKVTIMASFADPATGKILSTSISVFITPGPDHKVWIEPDTVISPNDTSAASLARLRNPTPFDLIPITGDQTQAYAYAVVRDKYGNFTRLATNAVWNEVGLAQGIMIISSPYKPYVGLIVRLEDFTDGTTEVRASETGLIADSATVKVKTTTSSRLEFLSIAKAREKARSIREFYNLRGQKLSHYGIRHADGIVLEKVIEPSGRMSMVKMVFPRK
jgi:fibro-slime domain-containing protein